VHRSELTKEQLNEHLRRDVELVGMLLAQGKPVQDGSRMDRFLLVDAARDRGEVASQGKPSQAEGFTTVADIGLTHKDIHEARQIRDAEEAANGRSCCARSGQSPSLPLCGLPAS